MSTWINNYNKEELLSIIQIVRKINGNYRRMKDSTILKKLINNEITKEQFATLRVLRSPTNLMYLCKRQSQHAALDTLNNINITILKR